MRNFIASRKKKNDFERGFLKSFEVFYGEALAVVKLQKEELEKAAGASGKESIFGICHGDYNQHNVVFSRQGIAVLNFENHPTASKCQTLGILCGKYWKSTTGIWALAWICWVPTTIPAP